MVGSSTSVKWLARVCSWSWAPIATPGTSSTRDAALNAVAEWPEWPTRRSLLVTRKRSSSRWSPAAACSGETGPFAHGCGPAHRAGGRSPVAAASDRAVRQASGCGSARPYGSLGSCTDGWRARSPLGGRGMGQAPRAEPGRDGHPPAIRGVVGRAPRPIASSLPARSRFFSAASQTGSLRYRCSTLASLRIRHWSRWRSGCTAITRTGSWRPFLVSLLGDSCCWTASLLARL